MRVQNFSKNTLKSMALKVVHYALIALAVVVGLAVLYWRWRRVSSQNKALEAELRLVQPYNNMEPPREVVAMAPAVAAAPAPAAKVTVPVAEEPTPAKPASVEPIVINAPPVLTPAASVKLAHIEESEEEEEEPIVGIPPTLEADPMFADFSTVFLIPAAAPAAAPLADTSNITELPDDTPVAAAVEEAPPAETIDAPKTTVRRRRKN